MTPEEQLIVDQKLREVAEILYNNTPREELATLESKERILNIEASLYLLESISWFKYLYLVKKWDASNNLVLTKPRTAILFGLERVMMKICGSLMPDNGFNLLSTKKIESIAV